MAQPIKFNVGGTNANVNANQINFSDGTVQATAAKQQAQSIQVGIVTIAGTSVSVVFAKEYTAAAQPIVVLTGTGNFYAAGLFYSITINGPAGNWMGFTINLSGSYSGTINWLAVGNPF
jgi:hypothetical protein